MDNKNNNQNSNRQLKGSDAYFILYKCYEERKKRNEAMQEALTNKQNSNQNSDDISKSSSKKTNFHCSIF